MTTVQVFRRQGQFHKAAGDLDASQASGAYTTELYAWADFTLSGTVLVAATTGKRIRVLAWEVSNLVGTVNTMSFRSNATQISGQISLLGNTAASAASESGLFQTAVGEDLRMNQTAGTGIGVTVTYILVD